MAKINLTVRPLNEGEPPEKGSGSSGQDSGLEQDLEASEATPDPPEVPRNSRPKARVLLKKPTPAEVPPDSRPKARVLLEKPSFAPVPSDSRPKARVLLTKPSPVEEPSEPPTRARVVLRKPAEPEKHLDPPAEVEKPPEPSEPPIETQIDFEKLSQPPESSDPPTETQIDLVKPLEPTEEPSDSPTETEVDVEKPPEPIEEPSEPPTETQVDVEKPPEPIEELTDPPTETQIDLEKPLEPQKVLNPHAEAPIDLEESPEPRTEGPMLPRKEFEFTPSRLVPWLALATVAVLAFWFAILAPVRKTRIPASVLEKMGKTAGGEAEPAKTPSRKLGFLAGKPLFVQLVNPKTEELTKKQLGPNALAFYQNLIKWEKGRKPRILYPVSDRRGRPTELLFMVFATLVETEDLSFELRNKLERQLVDAPKGTWGKFEKSMLAMLFLSKRLEKSQLGTLCRLAAEPRQLAVIAAYTQCMPKNVPEIISVAADLEPAQMDDFLTYLAHWGVEGVTDLDRARKINPQAFAFLLKEQSLIGRDWPKYLPTGSPPFSWVTALHQDYPEAAFYGAYGVMFASIFILLVALNGMFAELRGAFVFLFFLISIVAALLLFLGMEPGVAAEVKLPVLKFSHAISDAQLFPELEEKGESSMTANLLPVAFSLFFFVVQLLIFLLGRHQIRKIENDNEDVETKLKLLENEEQLFDLGLYVGLSGTVLSLIFLATGWANIGLMSAYTSTLFGIIAVALVKLLYLRPLKRTLILQKDMNGETTYEPIPANRDL